VTEYIRDGAEIYRRSFATIRAEAALDGLEPTLERTIVRMIHACGMTDLVADVSASPQFAPRAEAALRAGAPILCDTNMVASGITRSRLPADNDVVCTLTDPAVAEHAAALDTTRTAAVIGIPVGFIGAAESKVALAEHPSGLDYLVVHGRRGGSAIAAAAVNALASVVE
jgi:precorrin-8X/cobalt-precorrin-8 methylmutase